MGWSIMGLCPSVTSQCSTKTAKPRITQTTPHRDSSFLMPKISAKFDWGHPLWGRQMQVGWDKINDFQQITGYISKTVPDRCMVSIKVEQEFVRALSNGDIAADPAWPLSAQTIPFCALCTAIHSFVTGEPVATSNLVHWFTTASPTLPKKNLPWKGHGQGQVTHFRIWQPT